MNLSSTVWKPSSRISQSVTNIWVLGRQQPRLLQPPTEVAPPQVKCRPWWFRANRSTSATSVNRHFELSRFWASTRWAFTRSLRRRGWSNRDLDALNVVKCSSRRDNSPSIWDFMGESNVNGRICKKKFKETLHWTERNCEKVTTGLCIYRPVRRLKPILPASELAWFFRPVQSAWNSRPVQRPIQSRGQFTGQFRGWFRSRFIRGQFRSRSRFQKPISNESQIQKPIH